MARERYLLSKDEETIHKADAEIKADTKKSKWDNFWFYHKWHVLIVVAVCLLVFWFVHDMVTKVEPDYQIGLLTQDTFQSDVVDSLQTEIAKYGKDLNGDGKVVVQINSYPFMQSDTSSQTNTSSLNPSINMNQQQDQAIRVKYMADLAAGTSIIFLTDDTNFQNQQKANSVFAYTDGTAPKTGATDFEKMRVSWDQCKVLSQLKISSSQLSQSDVQKTLSKLSISLRVYSTTKEDANSYYAQSKALFNKLVNGK